MEDERDLGAKMDGAVEESWRVEVRRRVEELLSGAVPSIPGEQVFREMDELLR